MKSSIPSSAVSRAKRELVLAEIGEGGLILTDRAYERMRWSYRLTVRDVQRAIDQLAEEGLVVVAPCEGGLAVNLSRRKKRK